MRRLAQALTICLIAASGEGDQVADASHTTYIPRGLGRYVAPVPERVTFRVNGWRHLGQTAWQTGEIQPPKALGGSLRLRQGNQPNILAARDPGNRSRPTGAWRTGARGQGASGMLRATVHPCRVVVRTVRGADGLGEVEACLQVRSRGSLAPDQPMVTKTMTPAARAATAIPAKNIAGPATKSIMHCSSPIIRSPPCSFSFGAARDADGSACDAVLAKHAGPVDSPVLAGDG